MLKIIRNAQVKYILTDAKKEEIKKQLESELHQTKRELAQLTFQMQKSIKSQKHNEETIRKRYKEEYIKKEEQMKSQTFQLDQLGLLQNGTELKGETVETMTELSIGDEWVNPSDPLEIIVKDGMILDIRGSGQK
ncbi:YlqD family protein [Alkalihalophilus marmarensis]|uniref:YlqD family protein n=1 Tax=Alkalihalophilus marmarensis TaxID=521377 RepID=UPI00203C335F|nr:YlqD family protein [Alkalihalophilus marmarensis]MCM3489606.1 YlqD family protein [Alkalihalophilus marmarensis]